MKRIVVYTSKTGFTEKYAKWIAEELQCEAVELKKTDTSVLSGYDQVIYGGWVMGNMVSGYDKIKNLNLKELLVFCCGMRIPTEAVKKEVAEQNGIPADMLYCLEGGFAPERVGFMGKMIIKMMTGSIKKKEEKTPEELHMLETAKGADHTDRAMIEPLVRRALK